MSEQDLYAEAVLNLLAMLSEPPAGWYTFGHHADDPDVELEFWGDDGSGTPFWERPVNVDLVMTVDPALVGLHPRMTDLTCRPGRYDNKAGMWCTATWFQPGVGVVDV